MPCNVGNPAEGILEITYAAGSGELSLACTPTTLHTLTVAKDGAGSGTLTSSPAGIHCGTTCSSSFPVGTSVTLAATPASDSAFTGWSGACTGTGTCTVSMTEARSVTATFATTQILSVQLVSNRQCTAFGQCTSGSGRVVSSPPGIACQIGETGGSTTCSARFITDASVTLSAIVHSGSFGGWSGCTPTASTTCNVTMDGQRSVSASFNP